MKAGLKNTFLIVTLITFFMLIYVYANQMGYTAGIFSQNPEKFTGDKYSLIPADSLRIYQGSTLPDGFTPPIQFDTDDTLPTVDGRDGSAKSMFMMSFNKCDPSCCPSTYSCSGGCVCLTKDQQQFIGTRGSNNKATKCGGFSEF